MASQAAFSVTVTESVSGGSNAASPRRDCLLLSTECLAMHVGSSERITLACGGQAMMARFRGKDILTILVRKQT